MPLVCCMCFVPGLFGEPGKQNKQNKSSEQEGQKTSEERTQQIQRLLDQFLSGEEGNALQAEMKLLQIGQPVLPHLENRIKQSEARKLFELYRQLDVFRRREKQTSEDTPRSDLSVKRELKELDQKQSNQDTDAKDRFLISKYREALNIYKEGELQKAKQLIESLLTLAPEFQYRDRAEKLLYRIKKEIVNSSVVQATIRTNKPRYEWGEVVRITYALKNVSDQTVKISFDTDSVDQLKQKLKDLTKDSTETTSEHTSSGDHETSDDASRTAPSEPVKTADNRSKTKNLFSEVIVRRIDKFGSSVTQNEHHQHSVPNWIQLAPGATWSKTVILKTSDYKKRPRIVRRFNVKARVRPALIVKGEDVLTKWIIFQKGRFQVFPDGTRAILPATKEKVRRHLQSGNLFDVFLLSLFLEDNEKKKTIRYFLEVLPDLNKRAARSIMFLLRELTGKQFQGRRKLWQKWGEKKYGITQDDD